ncbi:MAG: hypothetical protein QNJ42_25750 [Crocosphaera sp.]|nr:hypothetical protein [Crocosphaera sp.]
MVLVYFWVPPFGFGHVGCQITPSIYIGHHPKNKKRIAKGFLEGFLEGVLDSDNINIFDTNKMYVAGQPMPSYRHDCIEMKRPAESVFKLDKLSDSAYYAAERWQIESPTLPYRVDTNNCASMVAAALHLTFYDYLHRRYGETFAKNAINEIHVRKSVGWLFVPGQKFGEITFNLNPMKAVWTPEDVCNMVLFIEDVLEKW